MWFLPIIFLGIGVWGIFFGEIPFSPTTKLKGTIARLISYPLLLIALIGTFFDFMQIDSGIGGGNNIFSKAVSDFLGTRILEKIAPEITFYSVILSAIIIAIAVFIAYFSKPTELG
jgi:hypothetical protein